jgi:hypothetical protein
LNLNVKRNHGVNSDFGIGEDEAGGMEMEILVEMVLEWLNGKLTFDEIDGPHHRLSIISCCIARSKCVFKGDFVSDQVLNHVCKPLDGVFSKMLIVASDAGNFVSGV